MSRVSVLNSEVIEWKLLRMAYQIWENTSDQTDLLFLGIEKGGLIIADILADHLRKVSGQTVQVLTLKIDKRSHIAPSSIDSIDFSGKTVVLIDDVANSGKTLLYALRPLLSYNLQKVIIAVLVDRQHKSFPISPDIIGHTIATTLQENIVVTVNGNNTMEAFLE